MSWVNPVFPIDTENSIGFIVQFFLGQAPLVGDSVAWNVMKYLQHKFLIENILALKIDEGKTITFPKVEVQCFYIFS